MEGETIAFLLWCFLAVIIIIGVWWVLSTLLDVAYGQKSTAPPAVVPTPSQTPIQIQPNPNFEYLPQKAYVQTYKPEIGIPVGQQPLTAVPQVQVQPVQSQASNILDQFGGVTGVVGMLTAAGVYVKTKFMDKKTDKNKETIQDVAQTQVKQIEVEEEHLGLTYDNMPQKGNEITNKPIIKQDNIKEIKDKAIETAAKA